MEQMAYQEIVETLGRRDQKEPLDRGVRRERWDVVGEEDSLERRVPLETLEFLERKE